MKAKLEAEYKRLYTIEEVRAARRVIREVAQDETTAEEWAAMAAREALKGYIEWPKRVVMTIAETGKNWRAWDAYFEGSGQMDIWIWALVETSEGYMECSAYLTDIWQTGAVDYREHMYIRKFKEVR